MVQVVRIPDNKGTRVLYLREGGLLSYRQAPGRLRDCVVRRLPDHEGRVLVEVDGQQQSVPVADLVEA